MQALRRQPEQGIELRIAHLLGGFHRFDWDPLRMLDGPVEWACGADLSADMIEAHLVSEDASKADQASAVTEHSGAYS